MAEGITKQEMAEVFEKFFGVKPTAGPYDPKKIDEFIASIEKSTKQVKDSLPLNKQVMNALTGTKEKYVDITDELDRLEQAIEDQRKAGKFVEAEMIERAVMEKKQVAAMQNAKVAMSNLATGAFGVLGSIVDASMAYAKGLQSGQDGITTATQGMVNKFKIEGEAAGAAGSALSGMGSIATAIGGKYLKPLGTIADLAGQALGVFGQKAAKYAGEAAQFLGDELGKTQKAHIALTQTGAVLAGGMTELRSRAADAGLDVTQFAETIKKSTESLQMMGMGMGEGAKRIGSVSKELRNSEMGTQLQKLGYSFEEQGELAAQVMANNNAAGNKRAMSDTEIAKQTADYGKSLKILQDITGEDAKKAMEKARVQAMEADLYAQAMQEGGPEAVKKLQAQLATMPESLKKGYMEFVSTGGKAIADGATNVAITQNPKIMEQYRSQLGDLKNAGVDQKQALLNAGKYTEQTGKFAKDNMDQTRIMGMAGRLTGDATVGAVSQINNALIMSGTKIGEGATKAAEEATEGAAVNTAPLDKAVTDLEAETQRTKAALSKELTPAITNFAGQLKGMASSVKETMEKLGIKEKSTGEKVGGAVGAGTGAVAGGWAGGAAGAAAGAAIGSVVPLVGTAIGGIVGGLLGSMGGGFAGGKLGEMGGEWLGAKFAVGGMVDKPTKALIGEAGPEAVVPLPDGRRIPVTFNNDAMGGLGDVLKNVKLELDGDNGISELTAKLDQLITAMGTAGPASSNDAMVSAFSDMQNILTKQLDKHEEMINHMRDNKDYTEKLLKVSM